MTNANIDIGWGHEHRKAEYGVEESYFVLYMSHSIDFYVGQDAWSLKLSQPTSFEIQVSYICTLAQVTVRLKNYCS